MLTKDQVYGQQLVKEAIRCSNEKNVHEAMLYFALIGDHLASSVRTKKNLLSWINNPNNKKILLVLLGYDNEIPLSTTKDFAVAFLKTRTIRPQLISKNDEKNPTNEFIKNILLGYSALCAISSNIKTIMESMKNHENSPQWASWRIKKEFYNKITKHALKTRPILKKYKNTLTIKKKLKKSGAILNVYLFKSFYQSKLKKLPKKLRKNLEKPSKIDAENYRRIAAQYVEKFLEHTRTKSNGFYSIKDHKEFLSPVVNEMALYDKELQNSIKNEFKKHYDKVAELYIENPAKATQHITWFPVNEMSHYCNDVHENIDGFRNNYESKNISHIVDIAKDKIRAYKSSLRWKSKDRRKSAKELLDELNGFAKDESPTASLFKIINADINTSISDDEKQNAWRNEKWYRKIFFKKRNTSLKGSQFRRVLMRMQLLLIQSCPNKELEKLKPHDEDKKSQLLLKCRLKEYEKYKELQQENVDSEKKSTYNEVGKLMVPKINDGERLLHLQNKSKELDQKEKKLFKEISPPNEEEKNNYDKQTFHKQPSNPQHPQLYSKDYFELSPTCTECNK